MSIFMNDWRRYFLSGTDAAHSYCEASGLACLSTVALGKRWLTGGSKIRPNLYMMFMGDSTTPRKSTSVKFAREFIQEVRAPVVGPSDYTMEGLFKWLSKKDAESGKTRNKVALFQEEYGQDLARRGSYVSSMAEDFCRLYDGEDYEKVRAKGNDIKIVKPRVNLFGAVAYHFMEQYLSIDDWYTGFLMRFLYTMPMGVRPTTQIQAEPPPGVRDGALSSLIELQEAMGDGVAMTLSPQAISTFKAILAHIGNVTQQDFGSRPPPVVNTYLGRFQVNLQKLAMLYQIDLDPSAPVSNDAMLAAGNFIAYVSWPSFLHAYKVTTKNDPNSVIAEIIKRTSVPGGVVKRDLMLEYMANPVTLKTMQFLSAGRLLVDRIDQNEDGEVTVHWYKSLKTD